MEYVLQIIWFILPAGVSNMFAAISAKLLPKLNYPVDFHKSINKKRILGDHKTFRGLIFGVIFGTLFFVLQIYLSTNFEFFKRISLIDYSNVSIILGFLLSFGALLGDMIKSFVKRQIGIEPGKSMFVFDQTDWLLGSIILSLPLSNIRLLDMLFIISIGLIMHVIVKFIGFLLKIDKSAI